MYTKTMQLFFFIYLHLVLHAWAWAPGAPLIAQPRLYFLHLPSGQNLRCAGRADGSYPWSTTDIGMMIDDDDAHSVVGCV